MRVEPPGEAAGGGGGSGPSEPHCPGNGPVVGITMGEPAGIGPEVIVKALADPEVRGLARYVIYGMNEQLAYAADVAEVDPFWHRLQHDAERAERALMHDVVVLDYDELSLLSSRKPGPSRQGGAASLAFIDDAIAAARRPIEQAGIDAIVTAPISKTSWSMTRTRFPGHSELLQHRTKARRMAMMFHGVEPDGRPVRVTLATIHLPLMDLRNQLSIGAVFDPIDLTHQTLRELGVSRPRIGVLGLNPHAGENGRFGDEEYRVIEPAIRMAVDTGIDAVGPLPPDTAFIPAQRSRFDAYVAMYHDQGLIPMKMLAFDNAVNHTLGLPIIRTSVDHGTAFDLVGKNTADPGSMKAAIRLAVRLARGRSGSVADRASA